MTSVEFGKELRKKRKESGISLTKLREQMPSHTITRLENGKGNIESLFNYLSIINAEIELKNKD